MSESKPTDLETLCSLYDRAGVAYEKEAINPEEWSIEDMSPKDATLKVTVGDKWGGPYREAGDRLQHFGYPNFYCCHYFDTDGKLIGVGVWE